MKGVTLSPETAARLAAAARRAEGMDAARTGGGSPPLPDGQHSEHRHAWVVKVTGRPDPETPALWPAVARTYTGQDEDGENQWEDWGETCWAVPIPGEGDPESARTYLGTLIGEIEGRGVYAVAASGAPSESAYPACEGSGSGSAECVVWYSKHMHLGAVAVAVGEVVRPGQLVGYLGWYETGAHLHFTLGDGRPLVWPGFGVPIAGGLVDLEGWLADDYGIDVVGPRTGCSRGGLEEAAFTEDELAYIRERFALPVRGGGWVARISSPFHCDYEYFAVDLSTATLDNLHLDTGAPTYNAVAGDDVVTTVETIWRGPDGGFAVVLRHQSACCDPSSTGSGSGDPHTHTSVQFPGRPPVTPPPSGVPRPFEPGSFSPVTRLCLGDLDQGTLIGRASAGAGLWEVLKIGPGLKVENGVLMVDSTTIDDPTPEYVPPYVPVTVERTRVTVPAGMLIQETVCSPPATTCCDGPTDPCPVDEWDPILPVSITGPFDVGCAAVDLVGEVAWDDAQWRYEGFVFGTLMSADGYVADVQVKKEGADWVMTIQFVGVGDDVGFSVEITLADGPDGTTLVGTLIGFDRPTCSGDFAVEVGHPCPEGGWPSDPDPGINVPCGDVPGTLTFSATQTGGTACVPSIPTGGSAISGAPGVWSFGATSSCVPFPSGWTVTVTCTDGVYTYEIFENATSVKTGMLTVTSAAPFAASATVAMPGAADCCPDTIWIFEFSA